MDAKTELYADELAKLIQCETVSAFDNKNEAKFARFHALLEATYPLIHKTCTLEKFDCSLLFRWSGRGSENPICLMSHHDVVEATGSWSHPPFGGEIAEGRLWGRGTLDTKGFLWAILRSVEELIAEGFVPSNDVYIVSASTEETDGSGADMITKSLAERGVKFSFVIDEGGMIMHDPLGGCDADFAMIGVGEKAYADIRFVAKSSGGHAATPPKDTPLVRLGKFMAEADKAKCFASAVSPTVCKTLGAFAPYSSGILKFLFGHAKGLRHLLAKVMPAVSPSAAAMLRTTLAFTQAGGSEGTNVLPQEAFVIGNIRSSHHQGLENSIKAIERIAKKYNIETIPIDVGIPSRMTSTDSDGYKLVTRAVETVFEGTVPTPYIMNCASDSRYFDRVSDCCIRFAPFKIDEQQLGSIHGIDENIALSALPKAVEFFKYIIRES